MNNEVENLTKNMEMLNKIQQELVKSNGADGSSFMGFSMTAIVLSIVFSMIGWILFRHGKKNGPLSTSIYGILLMVFPYFVSDTAYMIAIGIVLCILPFVVEFG